MAGKELAPSGSVVQMREINEHPPELTREIESLVRLVEGQSSGELRKRALDLIEEAFLGVTDPAHG